MPKKTSKKAVENKFLPSRSDYNYTTVVNRFEKYAFTYYFVYELAARNNYVVEALGTLKNLFDLYLALDEINMDSSLTVNNVDNTIKKIFTNELLYKTILEQLTDGFDNEQFGSKLNEMDFENIIKKFHY